MVTLAAILMLIVTVGVLWRLVRLAIRVALLLALLVLIAVYSARPTHDAHSRTHPPSQAEQSKARPHGTQH